MDHQFLAGEYQNVEVFSDDQYECMAKVDFSVLSYLVKECGVGDARLISFLPTSIAAIMSFFRVCATRIVSVGATLNRGRSLATWEFFSESFLLLACTLVGSAL